MSEHSTNYLFLAENVSRATDKEFYAIGFGSNFFHQFTDAAVPLGSQLCKLETKILDRNDQKKKSADCIRQSDVVVESKGTDEDNRGVPDAFIFPLHLLDDENNGDNDKINTSQPNRLGSETGKSSLSAPQRIRRLMQWRRNSNKGKEELRRNERMKTSFDSGQNTMDSSNKNNPIAVSSAGATHNAMLVDGNIFITGTLHGRVYRNATIQRLKHRSKCTQISCGKRHLLALFQNKTVMSMGSGYFGQLGHGTDKVQCKELTVIERLSPRFVHGEVVSIEAGGMHSAAIVTKDVASWHNKHALKEIETKVYCWGSNKYGECAIDNGKGNSAVFHPTPMVPVRTETGKKVSMVKLSWGKLHCVGLSHQGHVYSWGVSARCGHGDFNINGLIRRSALKNKNGAATSLPKRIEALRNSKIVQISAGDAHTLALSESGRVFSWGSNAYGQLGFGHSMQIFSPRFVADLQFGLSTKGVKGVCSTKQELIEEAEKHSNMEESHPSSSTASIEGVQSSIDLSTTIGDILYPSTPRKEYSKKFQSHSSNAQSEIIPFVTAIHAAGTYSAAISSCGDLYTWGCSSGDQLGHYTQNSDLGTQENEGALFSQSKSRLRVQDSRSFDSKLNILIPKRVEWIRQFGLRVESCISSPLFMIAICSKRDPNDLPHVGRTLFEREMEKHSNSMDRIRLVRGSGPN